MKESDRHYADIYSLLAEERRRGKERRLLAATVSGYRRYRHALRMSVATTSTAVVIVASLIVNVAWQQRQHLVISGNGSSVQALVEAGSMMEGLKDYTV